MQLPSFYHSLWHYSEQEAKPHAAQIAELLFKVFPQMHLRFCRCTLITSPRLKFLSTPSPNSLIIPAGLKYIYDSLRIFALHEFMHMSNICINYRFYNSLFCKVLHCQLVQFYFLLELFLNVSNKFVAVLTLVCEKEI
jgi:hypothetical protein